MKMVKGKIKSFFCSNEFNNFFLLFTGIFFAHIYKNCKYDISKGKQKIYEFKGGKC